MKDLKQLLETKDRAKEFLKHPRHKLLDVAYQRINYERHHQGMKPYPMYLLGIKTSHLSLSDFDYLVKQCSQKGNFSRLFFGLLKVKKSSEQSRPIQESNK